MAFTHKRRRYAKPIANLPVLEARYSTIKEEKDGEVCERIVSKYVNVTDPENKENLPDFEDYTLSNLMAAGVPVNYVNAKVMEKTDPADIEAMGVSLAYEATVNNEPVAPASPSQNNEPVNTPSDEN